MRFGLILVVSASATCLAFGVWAFASGEVSTGHLLLCTSVYAVMMFGSSLGYHRLFSHGAFQARSSVRLSLGIAGGMALHGRLFWWVDTHRRHHAAPDTPQDPHSPKPWSAGFAARARAWMHAHVGWLISGKTIPKFKAPADLAKDPIAAFVNRLFPVWAVAGVVSPVLLGAFFLELSVVDSLIWGWGIPVFVNHQASWATNSLGHGRFDKEAGVAGHARNVATLALLTFGDSWHANHHALPASARHGMRWWQLDINYVALRALQCLGLVSRIRLPVRSANALRP